ncbi:MAG: transcription termination factor NusA [Acidobacteria bacterium]|nr:transcription termination factor NusA [Acidobacteriota bacterium]
MNNVLQQTIDALAKEKGIEADIIVTAIEDAVLTASRKYYKSDENLRTRFNPETGQVELFAVRLIVEQVSDPATEIALAEARELYGDEAEAGMEIEFPKPTDILGRIAAQTAKQVIFQKVREAERENVFDEYGQRLGEVVNGLVKRFESGDIIVEIGQVEALLPRREQSRAENYTTGDRVRAVIKEVNKNTKGPQIILSRTDPVLLIKLFEQEVPEIYDGTVVIRGAVREAGDRAKVAVASRERDVDPVGACVGMKGTRVQAIIRELRGEKIDIVEWSDDATSFVTNAISPARVQRVSVVDDAERVIEVVVEDRQLSLAIGKKGQNVRLAAKLAGWKIDIKSEEEKRREVEAQFDELGVEPAPLSVPGLDQAMVEKLNAAGIETVESMISASAAELSNVLGVSEGAAEALRLDAEAATMAAGGAVGTGVTEAVPQDGIEPVAGPTAEDPGLELAPVAGNDGNVAEPGHDAPGGE